VRGLPGLVPKKRAIAVTGRSDTEGGTPSGVQRYRLPGEWEVLVGRTAVANDYLSLKLARPADLWFHIRGMPGSHVVLRVPQGLTPDRGTRELAAAIAAYHSKARAGGSVAVSCTEARHVSKPPRAKPGTVTIRNESVLQVHPVDETRLATFRLDPSD
jgi:predicted ribosome quality control (RQC) complex YloA/Tae2 family protein